MIYNISIKRVIIGCTILSLVCTVFLQHQLTTDMTVSAAVIIENKITDLKVLPDVNIVKQLVYAFFNIVS